MKRKADNNLFFHPLFCRCKAKCFLLYFLFIFLCLHRVSSSASPNGLFTDSQQLISFKNALLNPAQLNNWLPTISPCNFTGVFCKASRVSTVDLTGTQLSTDFASVSSSLIGIENLESLVLKSCNLSGSLASVSKFSCSESLTHVDLADNSISGPLTDIFDLSVCYSLSYLNLSKNSMKPFVKGSRMGLSSLQYLDVSHNNISGQNAVSWLLSGAYPELQFLSLKGNKMAGNLPELNLKNTVYLDLSMNDFSTKFPLYRDCSSLEHLDLSSSKFFGEVGDSLSSCGKLSFLNLTNNKLTGTVPKLPSGSMQYFYLQENDFQGLFPAHVSDLCPSLLELDLSFNNLTGTVPESLGGCAALQLLDLSSNNFSGELPVDTLLKMTSLKTLVLSFNNFVGPLPDSLSKLKNLENLDVSSNNLSGFIPSGICQDPGNNLQVLYLQNNLFKGQIPESLSNCSQLVSLDLSFNYLTGTIPPSLGSLSKLRDVIAWLNQLHGEIPHEFMYLQSLENLILGFNDLTGSIPASLSNCSNLIWISLSNNHLTGEIPASLGQLAKLTILNLGNNSISGRIPGELGDCRSLVWLDLNTNLLNGSIPAYIKYDESKQCHEASLHLGGIRLEQLDRISTRQPCNLTRVYLGYSLTMFNDSGSMIFLDISYNKMEGSIPKDLGSMYHLSVLNLGHNELSGPIPQELDGLKDVEILDLSYNKLNGTIPQSLTGLTFPSNIDLSNNNLSGVIPAPFNMFPDYRFVNNFGLCGYPLPPCGANPAASGNQHQKSHHGKASLAGSVAMGLLFSLICIFGLIIVAVETKKRRKKKEAALEEYMENDSNSATTNRHVEA